MNAGEIVSIFLAAGFLIIALCALLITVFLIKALKSVTKLADSLQNTSEDLRSRVQGRLFAAIPAILMAIIGRILKRGR